jgi:hypothetical protein
MLLVGFYLLGYNAAMITSRLSPTGPIIQTVEQRTVTIPPTAGNTFVDFTVNVQSPLKPGAAVFLSFTRNASLFLVSANAELTAPGVVTATAFDVVGNVNPVDVEVHILIAAHDSSQAT